MRIKILIYLFVAISINIFSQPVTEVIDNIKKNYNPEEMKIDSFKIIKKLHIPGDFQLNMALDSTINSNDFTDYYNYDTIISKKISERYFSRTIKTYSIPETFGDELDFWLEYLPDPISGDLYDDYSYDLLKEISTNEGTEKFYGENYLKLKINVNKFGFYIKQRKEYNSKNYKSISLYIDRNTYLIAGISFEMIFHPKLKYTLKHNILFSEYRRIKGVLIPTKVRRINVDFVKTAVKPDVRKAFYNRIDENIAIINQKKENCNNIIPELQKKCKEYFKNANNEYFLLKQMINNDVFELDYEISISIM